MAKDLKALWDPKNVKTDCRHFRGHVPCAPHKKHGVTCRGCKHYEKLSGRILIIKLGAAGDVIRTTPLLARIRKDHPQAEIVWLTYFPDLVPKDRVNKVLAYAPAALEWLKVQSFDWLINLDKDDEAIALTETVKAKKLSGFVMGSFGKCRPAPGAAGAAAAERKWMTGIWDDLNRANTESYMAEIFRICGYTFKREPYALPAKIKGSWAAIDRTKTVVGLNTGCGARWTTRLWGEANWTKLAEHLKGEGFEVILLGGPQEDEQNTRIATKSGAKYLGHYELGVFIDLMDQCDVIVSQVTMAMHIAIGLGKRLVLMNNIFNANEFELYGKGEIVQPDLKCLGCFKQRFDANCPVDNCMELIRPERVAAAVKGQRGRR